MLRRSILTLALVFALCAPALAVPGTIYVDTGGATTNSGTTDNNTAIVSASSVAVTCGATTYGGATQGCQLPAGTDLSGVAADGSQAIYLSCMTNANQKIAWITAVDDANDQVQTTGLTITGCTGAGTEQFAIGGRLVWTPANVEAALRAGDTVQFNNDPASRTTTFITARTNGDSTTGMIRLIGKAGSRPKLNVTNTSIVITGNNATNWYVANLELDQDGASGDVVSGMGHGWTIDNIKISDGGGIGINPGANFVIVTNSEITGVGSHGIQGSLGGIFVGNYIHGVGGSGTNITGSNIMTIANNVISGNTARGILLSGAPTASAHFIDIAGNTIYGNGDTGVEVADADYIVVLRNNIIQENGNAANEYNVKWVAGNAELHGAHFNNLFFHSNCQGSGTGGPACVSGLTPNSTESTSDAAFTNAGSNDFTLQSSSPAKATGYPGVLLGGNTGYMDMGALQRQEPAGGGAAHIIGGGF